MGDKYLEAGVDDATEVGRAASACCEEAFVLTSGVANIFDCKRFAGTGMAGVTAATCRSTAPADDWEAA